LLRHKGNALFVLPALVNKGHRTDHVIVVKSIKVNLIPWVGQQTCPMTS